MAVFKIVGVRVLKDGVMIAGLDLLVPGHFDEKSSAKAPMAMAVFAEESAPLELRVNDVVVWQGLLKDLPKRFDYELKEGEYRPPPEQAAATPVPEVPRGELDDALWKAFHSGDEEEAAKLVKQGANLNSRDDHGFTLLSQCAMNGHYKSTRFLLEHGANANVADREGVTPLMMAAYTGCTPLVAMLLKHGANDEGHSNNGWYLRDWIAASDYKTFEIERLLREPARVKKYRIPADFINEWKS
jgi:hypothetical protein